MKEKIKKLDEYIDVINFWGEKKNVVAYDAGHFLHAQEIELVIYNSVKCKEIYSNLLKFCANNNIIVKSTDVCTYTTILRIEEK